MGVSGTCGDLGGVAYVRSGWWWVGMGIGCVLRAWTCAGRAVGYATKCGGTRLVTKDGGGAVVPEA